MLADGKWKSIGHTNHSTDVSVVSTFGQPGIEVSYRVCPLVLCPNSGVAIYQSFVSPFHRATKQSPIPLAIPILCRQQRPAYIHACKQIRVIEHNSRKTKEHDEWCQEYSQPFMMSFPCRLPHLFPFICGQCAFAAYP